MKQELSAWIVNENGKLVYSHYYAQVRIVQEEVIKRIEERLKWLKSEK